MDRSPDLSLVYGGAFGYTVTRYQVIIKAFEVRRRTAGPAVLEAQKSTQRTL